MKVVRVANTQLANGDLYNRLPLKESGYIFDEEDLNSSDPEELFEAAGRLCYKSFNRPNAKTATNATYLKHITDVGHFSILEHASVTYYVEGVSRAMLLELERHRFLSFSVVSQRYVDSSDVDEFPFVDHPVLRDLGSPEKWAIQNRVKEGRILYEALVDELTLRGYDRKTARGAARNVLEEGTTTAFFVSGNIRAWREIIGKRYSPAADAEIRAFAKLILDDLRDYCPNALQDFEEDE